MVLCPVTRDENSLIQYCRAIMPAQTSLNLMVWAQSFLEGFLVIYLGMELCVFRQYKPLI